MMSLLRALAPPNYRDLLAYISPAALSVINWREAAAQFAVVSKDLLDRSDLTKTGESLREVLPKGMAVVRPDSALAGERLSDNLQDWPDTKRKSAGEAILDLYFSQFHLASAAFLDLRLSNFREEDSQLTFVLPQLRHVFSDSFRLGMLAMYEGFYLDRPERLQEGLRATGLIPNDARDEQKAKTTALVFQHFGNAARGETTFSLEQFRQSFHALFLHLKENRIKLPADFLFLGVYLVTLYTALEKLGTSYDVRTSFENAWKRNHT